MLNNLGYCNQPLIERDEKSARSVLPIGSHGGVEKKEVSEDDIEKNCLRISSPYLN